MATINAKPYEEANEQLENILKELKRSKQSLQSQRSQLRIPRKDSCNNPEENPHVQRFTQLLPTLVDNYLNEYQRVSAEEILNEWYEQEAFTGGEVFRTACLTKPAEQALLRTTQHALQQHDDAIPLTLFSEDTYLSRITLQRDTFTDFNRSIRREIIDYVIDTDYAQELHESTNFVLYVDPADTMRKLGLPQNKPLQKDVAGLTQEIAEQRDDMNTSRRIPRLYRG